MEWKMKAAKRQEYGMKMRVWYSLYDRLLHADVLEAAFKKVKSSNGAPGIDGQSCKGFALNRSDEIAVLLNELRTIMAQRGLSPSEHGDAEPLVQGDWSVSSRPR